MRSGDLVMHPTIGPCEYVGRESPVVGGTKLDVLTLRVLRPPGGSLRIPAARAAALTLKPITQAQADAAMDKFGPRHFWSYDKHRARAVVRSNESHRQAVINRRLAG